MRDGLPINNKAATDAVVRFEKLLRPAEAATLLRIHPVTLLKWARQGKVPSIRLSARKVLFDPSQLTAWLESGYTDPAVRAA